MLTPKTDRANGAPLALKITNQGSVVFGRNNVGYVICQDATYCQVWFS